MKKMKKRSIFIVFFLLCAIASMFVLIDLFSKEEGAAIDSQQQQNKKEEESLGVDVSARVYYGSIINSYECHGVVNADENKYTIFEEVTREGSDKIEISVKIGDFIKEGDVLFYKNGKKGVSRVEGLVTDIIWGDDSVIISIIDFKRLYIDATIPYDMYQDITYDSKITIENDNEKIAGVMLNKGYRIENGYVNAKVGFDGYIIPGKEIEILIETGETKEMLFVVSDMIYNINDVYFCYVLTEDGKIEERNIEIGSEYIQIEDGYKFRYTEIISGLYEGETVVIVK